MMIIALLLVTVVMLSATLGYSNTWICTYEGEWDGYDGGSGTFAWEVTWEPTSEGWDIVGDYYASEGDSYLDGYCEDQECYLYQTYTSGSLSGNTYTWYGTYEDEWLSNTETINTFVGTWGYEDSPDDGGNWIAEAYCVVE